MSSKLAAVAVIALAVSLLFAQQKPAPAAEVTRATLDNGMRVVIIRDALAPVITVEQNYLVGGNDTPEGFPGMAHAQEHMAFRGCSGITADQIAAIYAQLGGVNNADTQQNITQYYVTVPAADLDIALRVDAACMQDIQDSEAEWSNEKGAIEQEVARDLSNPTYKFITRLNEDMFSGTVYSHDALGTKESFDATTGDALRAFYLKWYAPNNAILVIAGDVDPKAALAMVKDYYGKIEKKTIPARPEITLPAVKAESFTLDSNLPYLLARSSPIACPEATARISLLSKSSAMSWAASARNSSISSPRAKPFRPSLASPNHSRKPAWPSAWRSCPPREIQRL